MSVSPASPPRLPPFRRDERPGVIAALIADDDVGRAADEEVRQTGQSPETVAARGAPTPRRSSRISAHVSTIVSRTGWRARLPRHSIGFASVTSTRQRFATFPTTPASSS